MMKKFVLLIGKQQIMKTVMIMIHGKVKISIENKFINLFLKRYWVKMINITSSGNKNTTIKFSHAPTTGKWNGLFLLLIEYTGGGHNRGQERL